MTSSIINILPKNHFGDFYSNVYKHINHGDSLGIYAMPGAGVRYFLQFLELQLLKKNKSVIYINGGLTTDIKPESIEKKIISLSKKENIDCALQSFSSSNKLFIIINDLQEILEHQRLLNYLYSLRRSSTGGIVNILSMNYQIFSSLESLFIKHGLCISNLKKMPAFDLAGTKRILDLNNQYYDWNFPLEKATQVFELSGGNARLIKYISKFLIENNIQDLENLEKMTKDPIISSRLDIFIKILLELDYPDLVKIGIVKEDRELFSPLLQYYFDSYEIKSLTKQFKTLTLRERQILSLLYLNKDEIVKKSQLNILWGLKGNKQSIWASYKAISRLRTKISKLFDLKNVKGKGYILRSK